MRNEEKVWLNPDGTYTALATEGASLLDTIIDANISIDHSCGGNASCGTCRVVIVEGADQLPPRNDLEADFIENRGWSDNERLACQLIIRNGSVKFRI